MSHPANSALPDLWLDAMSEVSDAAPRPNLAVNRTPAGGAGHGERLVGAG
jgi:hypothetical protein